MDQASVLVEAGIENEFVLWTDNNPIPKQLCHEYVASIGQSNFILKTIYTTDTSLENKHLDIPVLTIVTQYNLDETDKAYDLDDIVRNMFDENVTKGEQLLRNDMKIESMNIDIYKMEKHSLLKKNSNFKTTE